MTFIINVEVMAQSYYEESPGEIKKEDKEEIDYIIVEESREEGIETEELIVEEVENVNLYYPRSPKNPYKFKATEIIAPAVLFGVGIWGLENNWWRKINENIKHDLQKDNHHKLHFDDYIQFLPAVAGYGMNVLGFKGIHDTLDATIIYGTAYILLGISLYPMKHFIHSPRPSLYDNESFPSGHTAIAFAGAELLRREYWNVSPWIGIAGYLVAAGTGFMRLYNDSHWLNDVIAGAGLGILCAEAAYWLYPVITKAIFKKRAKTNIYVMPSVSKRDLGLAASITF